MSRLMRLYYYAVLGAVGGLIGWQVSNLIGLSFMETVYLSEVVVGGLVGLSIGLLLGFSDAFYSRSILTMLRSALVNGALGMVGGAVGLPLAEWLFQTLGGEAWSRALGWGGFGLLLGAAVGVTGGSQIWKPALGGMLGGLLGGAALESARFWLADTLLGKAVGLSLVGAFIGTFIALIVLLLSRAWLEVVSGKLQGNEFILDKFLKTSGPSAYIGSSALKADIVLPDPDVAPQHAMIKGADSHFTLKDMSLDGTYINNHRIELASLKNRQVIRVGNTEMVYHERRS
jgi:hypothetical protein